VKNNNTVAGPKILEGGQVGW